MASSRSAKHFQLSIQPVNVVGEHDIVGRRSAQNAHFCGNSCDEPAANAGSYLVVDLLRRKELAARQRDNLGFRRCRRRPCDDFSTEA